MIQVAKKVLRILGILLLLYFLFLITSSLIFRPQNIKITNVTSNSATVSWYTNFPMHGAVSYSGTEDIPFLLHTVFAPKMYDDRDVSYSQIKCVNKFNEKAKKEVDESFTVSGENYNCEDIKVSKTKRYYVHHVTIKNLDENSTYYIRAGDNLFGWKGNEYTFNTYGTPTSLQKPIPIFGRVKSINTGYSNDSIMYVMFRKSTEDKYSQVYSSVSNEMGGWYIDGGNVRNSDGTIMDLKSGQESVFLQGIYKNKGIGTIVSWVFGEFDGAYPDYEHQDTDKSGSSFFRKLVNTVFANSLEDEEINFLLQKYPRTTFPSGNNVILPAPVAYSAPVNDNQDEGTDVPPLNVPPAAPPRGSCSCSNLGACSEYKSLVDTCGYGNVAKAVAAKNGGNLTVEQMQDSGLCQTSTACVTNMSSLSGTPIANNAGTVTSPTLALNSSGVFEVGENGSSTPPPTDQSQTGGTTQTGDNGTQLVIEYLYVGNNNSLYIQSVSGTTLDDRERSFYNLPILTDNLKPCSNPGGESCTITLDMQSIPIDAYVSPLFANACVNNPQCPSENIAEYLQDIIDGNEEDFNLYWGMDSNWYNSYDENNGASIGFEALIPRIEDAIEILNTSPTIQNRLLNKAYAAEVDADKEFFYLPEYGIYSFELDGTTLMKKSTGGADATLLYINMDGVSGYQPPKDVNDPQKGEDVIISSELFNITASQKTTSQKYTLKSGINIVSFGFIPVTLDDSVFMAKDLINLALKGGIRVEYITYFDSGRWLEGLKCVDGVCIGSDFAIAPGKGYLIKLSKGGEISIPAYTITSTIPVILSSGWNLVGIHGYPQTYTAKSLIDSVNTLDGLTADNVSWYPTSKGRYEGLQVSSGIEYGFDFPISPLSGYFIRITNFNPNQESCNAVIWHAGSQLHGQCSAVKSPPK